MLTKGDPPPLKALPLGIHAGGPEVYLHLTDAVRLGVAPMDRIHIDTDAKTRVPAVVNLAEGLLPAGTAGLSAELTALLGPGATSLRVRAAPKPASVELIRRKLDGVPLEAAQLATVVHDVAAGYLTQIELTAWAAAIHSHGMDLDETVEYTRAMAQTGQQLRWERGEVVDVHSVGGLPGNKYAPITVAIAAASGLTVPKTSSRAISSACGTADFMEVFCPVDLSPARIQEVARKAGACLAWGGGVGLAPADDAIIRVEYPLGLDPPAQLVASVLAKKVAAGVERVLIDIPITPGGKVPTRQQADRLARLFRQVAGRLGLDLRCLPTPGGAVLGRAVGPVLEAREVLQTLSHGGGPRELVEKSTGLAGQLLEMGSKAAAGEGEAKAREALADGQAYAAFRRIVAAQGGDPDVRLEDLEPGAHTAEVAPRVAGLVELAPGALVAIARAAGAPQAKGAGLAFLTDPWHDMEAGEPLLRVHAETASRLEDATDAVRRLTSLQVR